MDDLDRSDPWATATTSRSPLPHWTEITRDELTAFLAKLRVGIEQQEDWKQGPTAMLSRPEAVADAIASHSHGLRLNEAAGQHDVVDAHICCEHAAADPELTAAEVILGQLKNAGATGGTVRVLAYVADRYGYVFAPED